MVRAIPPSALVLASKSIALVVALAGCGSPQPAAAPPAASAAPAPMPSATVVAPTPSAAPAPSSVPAPSADIPPPVAAPAPAADESGPSRSQKPIEIMTARDAAFLVDYANSDAKQRADESCSKESDPEKVHACLDKAREAFQADVLRFKRDQDNKKDWEKKIQLLIYKRNGSALREVSVGMVELAEEGADGVRVKLGKQKGARPLWRGQPTALIRAPNDYSIEFDDPEYGHLRYDAKIGLVTQ